MYDRAVVAESMLAFTKLRAVAPKRAMWSRSSRHSVDSAELDVSDMICPCSYEANDARTHEMVDDRGFYV